MFGIDKQKDLTQDDVAAARSYIHRYWKKLRRYHTKDDESLLGLPNPYLVPSSEEGHEFDFNEMYYWDTYFMIQGLLDSEHKELVLGMIDNFVALFKKFKIIPNASRTYLTGRTQPPFLTSLIFEVYLAYGMDRSWLKKHIEVAKQEYETVWMGESKPNWRKVYMGLSRYYDINMINDLAEAESGWDMTPRFNRHALDYLPVDLNALLYKYEIDFAKAAHIFDDRHEIARWEKAARDREKTMNNLMWDHKKGLFYDYNYIKSKKSNQSSLASYYTMWSGMADGKQAHKMVKNLRRFEHRGGLSTTDLSPIKQIIPDEIPTQWAYPNGWAPLHLLVIEGLERYGYKKEAKRIAMKWLRTNLDWFNAHGVFLEKYNVVSPDKPPAKGLYPSQTGFGWTNAVFERLCKEYIDK